MNDYQAKRDMLLIAQGCEKLAKLAFHQEDPKLPCDATEIDRGAYGFI